MSLSLDIIKACKQKDQRAQREVYRYLLPYLKPVANRYLRNNQFIKDVLQESFVKMFLKFETYNLEQSALITWATKIVIHTSINYNQRIIPIKNHLDIADLNIAVYEGKDDVFIQEISKEQLKHVLDHMPNSFSEVFNLHVIDGYDHEEISEILGISTVLSRKKLSRARAWIKSSEVLRKIVVIVCLFQIIGTI